MVDQVVDGSQDDGDQPGHNPRPELKSNYWPETFAVHLPTRDGQAIPIGAQYQGVVGGSHVYALMTTDVTPPPEPITLDGTDCEGNASPVTGNPGELVQVVQAPGQVLTVRFCDDMASRDWEIVMRCDPATDEQIMFQWDVRTNPPTLVSATNLSTGEPFTGDADMLVSCGGSKLESDPRPVCVNGQDMTQWVVKRDGEPTGVVYYTVATGELAPAMPPGAVITIGACEVGCPPVTYQGVVSEW